MPKRCAALEAQSKGVPVSKLRQFLDYISEHNFYEVSVVFDRQGVPLARTVCLPAEFALQVVKIRFPNAGETYLKAWGDCTLNERALALQDNCPLHGLKTAATLVKDGVLDASVFLSHKPFGGSAVSPSRDTRDGSSALAGRSSSAGREGVRHGF